MRRDEESGEDERETARKKEAYEVRDQVRLDQAGRSKCDGVAPLLSSPLQACDCLVTG